MAQLIVCERTSRWTTAFRWALKPAALGEGQRIRLIDVRNLDACRPYMREVQGSVVAIEAEVADRDELIVAATGFARWFPQSKVILLGSGALGDTIWILRELGIANVVPSIRDLTSTVRLVQRHLDRLPATPGGLRKQVWQRMPWSDTA